MSLEWVIVLFFHLSVTHRVNKFFTEERIINITEINIRVSSFRNTEIIKKRFRASDHRDITSFIRFRQFFEIIAENENVSTNLRFVIKTNRTTVRSCKNGLVRYV